MLEETQQTEKLKRSFLNDVQYVISRATKDDKQEDTPKKRLTKLGGNIDDDLNLWIKEAGGTQEQNGKLPESLAKETAKVVTDLIYARKVGHQREKSEKSGLYARFLWPLEGNQGITDPNYTHEPDEIERPLVEQMLRTGSLVIFQQPNSGATGKEDAGRESARLRISLQYQLYLKLQEPERALPVFAYLPATLLDTEDVEHTTLLWLCRCVANEVISYLCEDPPNRFSKKFSAGQQERIARLLAAIGYDVAAGGRCLFQPVPDAELLDVDAYYGSLLQTPSYLKLRPLLDAAKLHLTWMERPTPASMLDWTKTLLDIAGLQKAIVLVDNLEQPLERGGVTAAEYARVLAPLLANGLLLAAHQMDLLMFLPAAMRPKLEWRGVCFIDDTDLTKWFKTEINFDNLEAARFQFVL